MTPIKRIARKKDQAHRGAPKTTPRGVLQPIAMVIFLLSATPVLILRWVPPPTSMFMIIDHWTPTSKTQEAHTIQYQWVPFDEISSQLKLAVLASEDQTFAYHLGFNFEAIEKALEDNLTRKTPRGGSTISQQTAKNLFLFGGRSYLRKILEAYFTALIELSWPKQRILEVYLNIAEFGPGIYGAKAAANHFFGKNPKELGREESALLAAVLPNPKVLKANAPSAYLLKRQQWISRQMQHLGGKRALDDL